MHTILNVSRALYWFSLGYAIGTDSGWAWLYALAGAIVAGVARRNLPEGEF